MKKLIMGLSLLSILALCGCRSMQEAGGAKEIKQKEKSNMPMETTYRFLKEAGHYFIATEDEGGQPRVRPFGTIHIFEGKLYIQTGRRKNVARQLLANGKVEICAMKGDEWIRVSGTLVDDQRREAKASMLEEYSSLKSMYSADDENTMVLYFQPGTVTSTIWSFSHEPVVMEF